MADSQDFDTLGAKVAAALTKAPKCGDVTRRVQGSKEAAQLKGETAKGRHILL